jgi:ABC-2 type transport system permease protein
MNAQASTLPVGKAPAHKTHRFTLLLKREYWEHKGGFLWAPLVAGGISLLLTLMAIIVAEVAGRRAGDKTVDIDGQQISINALDLGKLTQHIGPEEARHLADGIDLSLLMASSWPFIVLGFVLFFYCLGALYDERKDRSVLFWKSLPLSDTETVLSKVASATLVAPAIATAAAIATMLGFLVLISAFVLLHGGNPVELVWGPGSPMAIAGQLVAAIPVYALWMLPTVGWLLLCSSWARSKPFLWAIVIPVFAGVIVTWFDVMQLFDLQSTWFWKNVVARMLFSVAPLTWMDVARIENIDFDGPGAMLELFSLKAVYSSLLAPQLWAGVVAGAAMIFGAIHLRRHRELAD